MTGHSSHRDRSRLGQATCKNTKWDWDYSIQHCGGHKTWINWWSSWKTASAVSPDLCRHSNKEMANKRKQTNQLYGLFHSLPLHYFDQHCVDIIDQVEYEGHNRLLIYPLCGIFYLPWHRHQIEWKNGFRVSSERHWQSGVKEIAKVSKRPEWGIRIRDHSIVSRAL